MDNTKAEILFGVLNEIKGIKSYHELYARIIEKLVSEAGVDLTPKQEEVVKTANLRDIIVTHITDEHATICNRVTGEQYITRLPSDVKITKSKEGAK